MGEDGVEGRGLVGDPRLGAGGVLDSIHEAVEHHRPHPVREQVDVDLADHRPVREGDEGEAVVADEAAQGVEVAGGVIGGDVVQEVAAHLTAAARQLDGLALVRLRLGSGDRDRDARPELVRGLVAGEALHR